MVIKAIMGILRFIYSAIWIFLAALFTSALWTEKSSTNDWAEDAVFIPIGIVMGVIWVVSLVILIIGVKNGKYRQSQ